MKNLLKLEDVNLSLFELSLDSNAVSIEYLNMYDGEIVAELFFHNIIKMDYQRSMDDSEVLPAYIGEVEVLHEERSADDVLFHLKMSGWLDVTLTSREAIVKTAH